MLVISVFIPGRGRIDIGAVVFDMNGTIALDGQLLEGVKPLLEALSEHVEVYVLTADTFKKADRLKESLPFVKVFILPEGGTGADKEAFLKRLGAGVAVVGNGYNDMDMFRVSALSIAVIGKEGACGKLLLAADIVMNDIKDAIGLFLNPKRVVATLRS